MMERPVNNNRVVLAVVLACCAGGCTGPYGRGWGTAGPIHRAAYSGEIEALRSRLKAGDDPNSRANIPVYDFAAGELLTVESPLSLAVRNHRPKTVSLLLQSGAEIESGVIPGAVNAGPPMMQIFIDAGLDPDLRIDEWPLNGGTALHWAAYYRDPEVVQLLLNAGADPTIVDKRGYSPTSLVINRHDVRSRHIAELLVSAVGKAQ